MCQSIRFYHHPLWDEVATDVTVSREAPLEAAVVGILVGHENIMGGYEGGVREDEDVLAVAIVLEYIGIAKTGWKIFDTNLTTKIYILIFY